MSIMVAMGRGAREGVLVKDAATLQELEKITTLVVDKTGTLTEGCPQLVNVLAAKNFDKAELLPLAASLEQNSSHPFAGAVLRGAKGLSLLPVSDFESFAGGGLRGDVAGKSVVVGKADFLRAENASGLEALEIAASDFQDDWKVRPIHRGGWHYCRLAGCF
jgi:Cu+-exporting ATPase